MEYATCVYKVPRLDRGDQHEAISRHTKWFLRHDVCGGSGLIARIALGLHAHEITLFHLRFFGTYASLLAPALDVERALLSREHIQQRDK